ncbi:MAG: AraC family transcriptional regulator [Luteolibacter sp.]
MESRGHPKPSEPPSFISTQVTDARRYYFHLNPRNSDEIKIVCGGWERLQTDYQIDRVDFPFFGIEYVAEGKGSLELASSSYQLMAGMAFAYGPGIPHRIINDPAAPMLKYYVDFTGLKAEQLLADSVLKLGQVVRISSPKKVEDLFEWFQQQGSSETRHSHNICAALLPILLMILDQCAIPYRAYDFRAWETYQRVKRVIESQFLTLRSVKEIALTVHADHSYLCRLFQRFDQTTPYRFLTKLKMNHAAALLLNQRMLVKEVAEQLEMDSFHFSRMFKRIYGISPEYFLKHR